MIALRASRAAAAAALLAACTPEYRGAPELVLPPMAAPATDLRAWWQQFDDPQLIAVVERALEHNTDLVAAAGRVAEAAALVRNADDLLPDSSLRASAGRNQTSDRNAFPRFSVIDRANAFHTIGIDATWELDLWGRIRAGHDAAEADLLRSDALRDSLRASLAARTAQSYLRLVAIDRRLALADEALANRREALAVQRRRADGGTATPLEVHQAEAEVEAVASTVPRLRAARDVAVRALLVLTGESPAAIARGEFTRAAELPVPPAVPEGLPSDLLARRPDLRAAEAGLAAADARVAEARSRYFPTIRLTGTIGQESEELSNLFTGRATVWSFAGQLVQPLFNLRKIDAQVDVAEARRVQAEADYVHAVQVAFAEVFDALSQRSASNATLASQHRHVEALERAERIAEVRHEAGVGTFLELLDVRRGLLAVREAQIDTAADELTATIDVYRALGGGWDPAGESDR